MINLQMVRVKVADRVYEPRLLMIDGALQTKCCCGESAPAEESDEITCTTGYCTYEFHDELYDSKAEAQLVAEAYGCSDIDLCGDCAIEPFVVQDIATGKWKWGCCTPSKCSEGYVKMAVTCIEAEAGECRFENGYFAPGGVTTDCYPYTVNQSMGEAEYDGEGNIISPSYVYISAVVNDSTHSNDPLPDFSASYYYSSEDWGSGAEVMESASINVGDNTSIYAWKNNGEWEFEWYVSNQRKDINPKTFDFGSLEGIPFPIVNHTIEEQFGSDLNNPKEWFNIKLCPDATV